MTHEERWRVLRDTRQPHVFLLWHEVLLPLLWQHRHQGVAIVVSEARDGQYLSDLAQSLGYRTVRGSSTRGGARALLGAVRELRAAGAVAFTPDGPRGPRRELKPGVVAAAQRGGATIVPIHAEADRAWRLHSWDRFVIPKPLARVSITYGRPFQVAAGEAGLAEGLALAAKGLDEVSRTDP
ncbi:MAG: lysophospholipid acyltransferase family protein [Gemmatimonadales bacterium]